MGDRQEMVVKIDGKKFVYKGKPAAKQRDFFEMLVKLKKGADVTGDQLAGNWEANFPDEGKSQEELLDLYQKETERQDKRKKDREARVKPEEKTDGAVVASHVDPAEGSGGPQPSPKLTGADSSRAPKSDAEHKEIQAFIDRILNEDEDDAVPHLPSADAAKPSPPSTSRPQDVVPTVMFKLDVGADALKVISLKKQPEGMFDELKKIAEAKCQGVQRLCFVDRDGDTIDVEDNESLTMFFNELEQREAEGKRLVMTAVFPKDEPAPAPIEDPAVKILSRGLDLDGLTSDAPATEPPMTARRSGISAKHTLKGHKLAVYTCAMTSGGKTLVTGSKDGTAKVWNLTKFSCAHTVTHAADKVFGDSKDAGSMVLGVDVTKDGKRFATSGDDKTVRLWDAVTGEKVHSLRGHSDKVYAVAFSPNSKLLASASNDNTIKLWDVETGAKKVTLRGHTQAVFAVSWSHSGRMLCSGSHDQTIKIWSAEGAAWEAKTAKASISGHDHCIWSVVFSPSDREVLSTSMGKDMLLWDIEGRKQVWKVREAHKEVVHRAIFILEGKYIASVARDGAINLWDSALGSLLYSVGRAHRQPIYCLCSGGFFIATSSLDQTIAIWHMEDLTEALTNR